MTIQAKSYKSQSFRHFLIYLAATLGVLLLYLFLISEIVDKHNAYTGLISHGAIGLFCVVLYSQVLLRDYKMSATLFIAYIFYAIFGYLHYTTFVDPQYLFHPSFVVYTTGDYPATAEQMVRLVLKGTNRSYDSLKSESLAKKGTFVILANTFEERTGKNFQKKFLKSFGLITDDGWLTNGGALFSDDCRLSQSRLYCTRWNGLEKDAAINDAEFSGNILLSTATQFMTIIYSMEYEPTDQQGEQHGTKLGLSWDQVGTKLGLSWDEVEKLFIALQEPKSMGELKDLYGWSNTTKFKAKYVSPLIEKKIVGMTLPDKPTSPKQKYFLTDSGKALLVNVTRNPNAGEEEKLNHLIGNLSEEEKRLALELLQKVQ